MNQQLKDLIQKIEVELLQADVRRSKERLGGLLADDFFEFGQSGDKYDKQDILEMLPQLPEEKFLVSDFEIQELFPETVLATYLLEREELETKKKSRSRRSSIYQKHNDTYRMLFHQGTPVADQ